MAERRAYRYRVTETGGAGVKAVGDSPYILDWSYHGRAHTWNIVGGLRAFETRGFITGRYVDKGFVTEDGQYESDQERDGNAA